MFTIKINTEGAAFCDIEGNPSKYDAQLAIVKILRDTADKIEQNILWGKYTVFMAIMDENGNRCGEMKFKK